MKKIVAIFLLIILSCQDDRPTDMVASYNDYILTKSDIEAVIPEDLVADDSIQFVNDFVERWVKDKVLMHEKDSFLTEEEINRIESQVAKYREDLTEIFIEEKLTLAFPSEVSEEELRGYYEKFPDTFILDKDILSYRLLNVPKDSARKYKRLLRNGKLEELKTKLDRYGFYYDFTPDNWIEYEKFKHADVLPEKLKNQRLLSGNQIYSVTQEDNTFIIEVVEVGREGKQAPFTYIKPTIKSVVLNKRKLNLLSQKKNELYEKALENDEIKRN